LEGGIVSPPQRKGARFGVAGHGVLLTDGSVENEKGVGIFRINEIV
jgi:hypothetical protein